MITINVEALAYETFQICRHARDAARSRALDFLALSREGFAHALEASAMRYDVADERLAWIRQAVREHLRATADDDLRVEPDRLALVRYCHVATLELERLWTLDELDPIRKLGYAMHMIPSAITAGPDDPWRSFKPSRYRGCVRLLLLHWDHYSTTMRDAVAEIAELPRDALDASAHHDDAFLELFGRPRQLPTTKDGA